MVQMKKQQEIREDSSVSGFDTPTPTPSYFEVIDILSLRVRRLEYLCIHSIYYMCFRHITLKKTPGWVLKYLR